eukprot:6629295-Prymnesium_polylepis.1
MSVKRASNLWRPRPQPRPSEPVGLGRSADPVATLEKRPAASPCSPKPTASLGTRSTPCGRQVLSLGNDWRRRG